jgi:hypothetical protein
MMVLVDYSNLRPLQRSHGLQQLVQLVLASLGVARLQNVVRTRVRLYGGWYEESMPSQDAQAVAAEVNGGFPTVSVVVDGARRTTTITEVELARSLLIEPAVPLEDTFRRKGAPRRLQCEPPPFPGCADPPGCVLLPTHPFINADACPHTPCSVRPRDILRRAEQKLVDTMLTADLIYLASQGETPIAVVSSDDDMWPGIRSALALGATIFHVHTMSGRITPPAYRRSVGPGYDPLHL